MKKKLRLDLQEIKIKSFVTNYPAEDKGALYGAGPTQRSWCCEPTGVLCASEMNCMSIQPCFTNQGYATCNCV